MPEIRVRDRFPQAIVVSLLFLAGLLPAGCGGEKLESRRLDRDIVIDGSSSEWYDILENRGDQPVSIGLMNDDEFLYICLVTGDRQLLRQVITGGLTVAFEPEKEGEPVFGIRFPTGQTGVRPEGRGFPEPGDRGDTDPARLDSLFRESILAVEFQGEDGIPLARLDLAEAAPVSLCAGKVADTFVYELRVPLERAGPADYAVGARSGETFSLSLATPELDHPPAREEVRSERAGGGGKGGFGSRGGGGGRGGGGRRGGGMKGGGSPPSLAGLDVEFKVSLAVAP